ncbi:MAG: alpha-(1-_3)-arabinofuranosyltransferase family protein [Ilumatobacteraceae bacterium]
MALIAYVPLLASRPGRMVADTKLYLYLNPGRLISDAPITWDTRQFAGWVPHQTISYLWPQGQWYWIFDQLAIPDWVAHRLWVGSLFLIAGLGVRHLGLRWGLSPSGALTAGLVYQLSPYVLSYASRTSAMLLPWAAFGWLMSFVAGAALGRRRWSYFGAIGLVLATIGAVNVTALLMIAPGPLIWLICAAIRGDITWRRVASTCAGVTAVGVPVSLWWISMSLTQRDYGVDVLPYSENLEAVSFTATTNEVLRGLGYWLTYYRDPTLPVAKPADVYMSSWALIMLGAVLLAVCLGGLVLLHWRERVTAVLLVAVGTVVAVGVHPIFSPSLLMSWFAENSRDPAVLALRSSTRALPMVICGLAVGAGALVTAVSARRPRVGRFLSSAVIVMAILNLPALFTGDLVDEALTRDERVPDSWLEAVRALEEGSSEYRVMQLPGSDFSAFRWGYTLDPPLPGLTALPFLGRDLLPLGSPGAMDLLYALDDRVQIGVIDPRSIAPISRLLAVETLWIPGDSAFERYRTPHPITVLRVLSEVPGIRSSLQFGEPRVNTPSVPTLDSLVMEPEADRPVAPVTLARIDSPISIVRLSSREVVLVGSGDGIIDAAAAGLLFGDEVILYAADGVPSGTRPAVLILTDSNRKRARHWRGTQDTVGATEPALDEPWALRLDDRDVRLPLFPVQTEGDQTITVVDSGLDVRATGYGDPYGYMPEHGPAMAVDGDFDTAWIVSAFGEAIGHSIRVSRTDGQLTLIQPQGSTWIDEIASIRVTPRGFPSFEVMLDRRSLQPPGQPIAVPPNVPVSITVESIRPRAGSAGTSAGVGFAELGLGKNPEIVRLPTELPPEVVASTPMAIVLTRLRVDPLDQWRSDPEPLLLREFSVPGRRTFDLTVTLRLDRRASDEDLVPLLGLNVVANHRLRGSLDSLGEKAFDGDLSTAWTSPAGQVIGTSLSASFDSARTISELRLVQSTDTAHSTIAQLRVRSGSTSFDVSVSPPDSRGISSLRLPSAITTADLSITVTGIRPRTRLGRLAGDSVTLPVSIREILGVGNASPGYPLETLGCRDDLLSINGVPVGIHVDAKSTQALRKGQPVDVGLCEPVRNLTLVEGTHRLQAMLAEVPLTVDRVVLAEQGAVRTSPTNSAVNLLPTRTRTRRIVEVPPCARSCWVTLGEGHNSAWEAALDGLPLGVAHRVGGGFNGWLLEPSDVPRTLVMTWTAQRGVTTSIILSAFAVLACAAATLPWRRRITTERSSGTPRFNLSTRGPVTRRQAILASLTGAAVTAVIVVPEALLAYLPLAILIVATRRIRLAPIVGAIALVLIAVLIAVTQARTDFPSDSGWPFRFDHFHRYALSAVVLLTIGSLVNLRRLRPTGDASSSAPRSEPPQPMRE